MQMPHKSNIRGQVYYVLIGYITMQMAPAIDTTGGLITQQMHQLPTLLSLEGDWGLREFWEYLWPIFAVLTVLIIIV